MIIFEIVTSNVKKKYIRISEVKNGNSDKKFQNELTGKKNEPKTLNIEKETRSAEIARIWGETKAQIL